MQSLFFIFNQAREGHRQDQHQGDAQLHGTHGAGPGHQHLRQDHHGSMRHVIPISLILDERLHFNLSSKTQIHT